MLSFYILNEKLHGTESWRSWLYLSYPINSMPFMELKVHCNAHKKLPLDLILRHLNPAHVLQFNIIPTGDPMLQKFSSLEGSPSNEWYSFYCILWSCLTDARCIRTAVVCLTLPMAFTCGWCFVKVWLKMAVTEFFLLSNDLQQCIEILVPLCEWQIII
jgi:hypothetical protein